MLWVLQENLYKEYRYQRFVEAVQRLNQEVVFVKVVPFVNKLIPPDMSLSDLDVDNIVELTISTNNVIAFGTLTLGRIAIERGWTPGVYTNSNFDYRVWSQRYGLDNIVNSESVVGNIKDIHIPPDWDWVFLRPVLDDKAFTGITLSKHDFHDWKMQYSIIEPGLSTPLHKDTVIMVSPAQDIQAEYRMFVVDREVVTGSLYKRQYTTLYDENVDNDVYWFAASMAQQWEPADAYVLDIARVNDELKVLEVNTINSAGFYHADPQKIVMALINMEKYGRKYFAGSILI